VGLQVLGGEAVDSLAVADTMGWAQSSLRCWLSVPKPFSGGGLRPSTSSS
jgi:hypothetical protein